MNLQTALAVARGYKDTKGAVTPPLMMYRARNGHYMTARQGNPAMRGRQQWTMVDFIAAHNPK